MAHAKIAEPRYYFALPRLIAWAAGGSARRTERNWTEAYFTGVVMVAITYLALVVMVGARSVVGIVLLVFATWILWLLLLYANSLLVTTGRALGLFRNLSNSRAQSILVGSETALCALVLLQGNDWLSVVGWLWLGLVAVNAAAAAALALLPARS